jgi:hypothetical protein
MSSGLDELERRGRWGRNAPPASRQSDTAERAEAVPKPRAKAVSARRSALKPIPVAGPAGVERVVIYLSPDQTAWIRERQIEALKAGKRVTTSKLIRELMDRAMR